MASKAPAYKVIKDTREQDGYTFESFTGRYTSCKGMVVKKLDTGDYSLEGLEDKLCIERKGRVSELAKQRQLCIPRDSTKRTMRRPSGSLRIPNNPYGLHKGNHWGTMYGPRFSNQHEKIDSRKEGDPTCTSFIMLFLGDR